MTDNRQSLQLQCNAIFRGCGEAIDWVEEARCNSPPLNREAPDLIRKMRRSRNLVRRLETATGKPMSIGFFGLSQAGKSYLISSLAADENGDLKTLLDGERLNFIDHINPPGHGKEATGLVTRFTRNENPAPPGYPIQLTLFSEADLVKILGNTFFNDFDPQKVEFNTDPEEIRKLLSALNKKRQSQQTGGINEDDAVDLMDYFDKHFHNAMKPLMGDYWPNVIELAPYLQPGDRATLFAVLWGGIADLSETYLRLRRALDAVQHADTAFCPLEALVEPSTDGGWSPEHSIMDVAILDRLGHDDDDKIQMQPVRKGELLATVELPRSVIATLTAEMRFQLTEAPVANMLENVDLLDFPGYRGRLKIGGMDDVRKEADDDAADRVAELLLRGKVSYLFERYTDNQEMNVLVVCAASDNQSNVSDMGPVLDNWIKITQGGTPEERAGRPPGLVWAFTRFDLKLRDMLKDTKDQMRKSWRGLTILALTEKFGRYEWLHKWTPDFPFNNVFLTRKAREAWVIVNQRDGSETGFNPEYQEHVVKFKSTFLADESIQCHVNEPEQAWDAVLSLNDGGISRLAEFLGKAARLENKLTRIREQADKTIDELVNHRLGAYYQKDGAEAVGTKEALASEVKTALSKRAGRFGELLYALQLPAERLRPLYLRSEEEGITDMGENPAVEGTQDDDLFASFGEMDSLIDLDLGNSQDETQPEVKSTSGAVRFAQDALAEWIGQLRDMPEHDELMQFIGLPKKIIENLGDELITGADRLKLEQKLIRSLDQAESRTALTRHKLVERQVLVARSLLNDFVDYLDNSKRPLEKRAASPAEMGRVLFEPPPPLEEKALPKLPPSPINYPRMYILDWFEAFRQLAIDNAGHDAGLGFTLQQNQRLGEILAVITSQETTGAAQSGS